MTSDSPRSSRRGGAPQREGLWPPPEGTWIAVAGLAPIFAAHFFYAGLYSETAFTLVMIEALVLAGLLFNPKYRKDLIALRGLTLPAALFGLVILVGLIQLTPWAPGGPHPIWSYVGEGPGSTTIDRSATGAELVKLIGQACIFLVGALTGASDRRGRTAIGVAIALAVPFSLWAFFGDVTGTVYQTQGRRLEGHFLNPNTAGTFMACMLLLSLAVTLRTMRVSGSKERLARAAPMASVSLLFAICLLMTGSRGAAAALIVALIVFSILRLFSSETKISRALIGGTVALIVGAALVLLTGNVMIDRLAKIDEAGISRTLIWSEHWQAFLKSPLLGYGLGSTETVNKTLITTSNYATLWNIKAILNVYLQWLEQAGLIGGLLMFSCIGAILVTTVSGTLKRSRMTLYLFGLLAVDTLFLAHGITDFALDAFSMAAMWAYFLGLQLSLSRGSGR